MVEPFWVCGVIGSRGWWSPHQLTEDSSFDYDPWFGFLNIVDVIEYLGDVVVSANRLKSRGAFVSPTLCAIDNEIVDLKCDGFQEEAEFCIFE